MRASLAHICFLLSEFVIPRNDFQQAKCQPIEIKDKEATCLINARVTRYVSVYRTIWLFLLDIWLKNGNCLPKIRLFFAEKLAIFTKKITVFTRHVTTFGLEIWLFLLLKFDYFGFLEYYFLLEILYHVFSLNFQRFNWLEIWPFFSSWDFGYFCWKFNIWLGSLLWIYSYYCVTFQTFYILLLALGIWGVKST